MSAQLITIKIIKWEKHNPRTDRVNYSWFKFQNEFFSDSKIYVLEPLQKLLLVYLFCEASKNGSGKIKSSIKQICDSVGLTDDFALKSLSVLETFGIIKLSDGWQDDVMMTAECSQKDTLEEKREEEIREEKNTYDRFDFESLYKLYPKKIGKADGMGVLKKTITTQQDFADFTTAIKNYIEHVRLNDTEVQYILQFKNFVGPVAKQKWRDYVDFTPRDTRPKGSRKTGKAPSSERDDDLDSQIKKLTQEAQHGHSRA